MCGCNKKRLVVASAAAVAHTPMRAATAAIPVEIAPATIWGPPLWLILHSLASKTGRSGNQRIDSDEGRHFENLIESLHTVLPCAECQDHCRQYLLGPGRDRKWRGLYGENLRNSISTWLSNFHNAVRIKQEKEILIGVDYSTCSISQDIISLVETNMKNASTINLVRANLLRRWLRNLNELKLLLGV